jgi:hypothetical protein
MASLLLLVMADPVCLCLKGSLRYISTRSHPPFTTTLERSDLFWSALSILLLLHFLSLEALNSRQVLCLLATSQHFP